MGFLGSLFGGGQPEQQAPVALPKETFNIPVEPAILPGAIMRGDAGLRWQTSPYRTIDYGHGEYNPQTMGMTLPMFNHQQPQQNGWMQPQFNPLGAYQYTPPGANSHFNPMGNYQGSQMGFLQQLMQMVNMFNQQQQQGQPYQQMGQQQQPQQGGQG